MNKQELIAFEEEIASLWKDAKIRAPIHLHGGNEDALIEIFQDVKPDDWVFSTHRSHYHALLKGIPPEWLREEILAGRSIGIYNAEHKFFTSAIVGGVLPIALGVALGIHLNRETNHVWVFVGDMSASGGAFHECTQYAAGHGLPITFVVEDNHFSVDTPTMDVWGLLDNEPDIRRYSYERIYPHGNIEGGQWVKF